MSINAEHKDRLVAPMTGAGKHSLCATCYAQSNLDSLMGSPARSLRGEGENLCLHCVLWRLPET